MIGKIVCSLAGSDKGKFSVVVAAEKDRVLISNGKRYKLSSPKSKNVKHLAFTDKTLSKTEYLTDKQLRRTLAIFAAKQSKE